MMSTDDLLQCDYIVEKMIGEERIFFVYFTFGTSKRNLRTNTVNNGILLPLAFCKSLVIRISLQGKHHQQSQIAKDLSSKRHPTARA